MTETDDATEALQSLAADLVLELGAAKAAEILQLAGVQEATDLGQVSQYGTPLRDAGGQFLPPPPDPAGAWAHTLRHKNNRGHLLESDDFLAQAYGRARGPGRDTMQAAHWGGAESHAGGPDDPSGGDQPAGGQQQAGGVHRDAAGLPLPGSDARGHPDGGGASGASGDIPLIQSAQAPVVQRPARVPRDRFGNRRYPRRRGR